MWVLKVSTADKKPEMITLKPGVLSLGRLSTNNIALDDPAASRRHAEVILSPDGRNVSVRDLESTNGTFVNRQRISGTVNLNDGDVIRVGKVMIYLSLQASEDTKQGIKRSTHRFTRELVLEALDHHAVSLYDASRRLNMVTDAAGVRLEVVNLLKRALGVEDCDLIPSDQFKRFDSAEFQGLPVMKAIRDLSAETTPTSIIVPVTNNDKALGLIYLKQGPNETRQFDQRDLQLVVALSYQASLALQRLDLHQQVRKQEQVGQLLRRFLSPQEADFLLQDYLESGHLPELDEKNVTIMFSDMADSTTLAERVGTRMFAQILSSYYQAATDIVFAQGGIIRYLGDGILAVFMNTPAIPNPEERAVFSGLEIVKRVNMTGALNSNQRFIIRVAVNSGKAMLGYVGNDERAEFTVLGDTVNVAYRMQEVAGPYKVVIGPATMAAVSDKFKTTRIGAIVLRGRERPIQLYEVVQ
jgi:adenylate cyclase